MLDTYWHDLPIGRENAITYAELCAKWERTERSVRYILHELSRYDNGDDLVLIRSSRGKGFYRTNNRSEIEAYKRECMNRARHTFAPLKKINRVLNGNMQLNIFDDVLEM